MMKKECRVVIYKEGLLGSLFFGEAKADPDKMSQFLSSYTREGWEVKTMSVERRRTALFWSREAYLFVLDRQHIGTQHRHLLQDLGQLPWRVG